jgi:hypothetical protein
MAQDSPETVAPFLSYLQKRMDFIAQVSTSPPSWCLFTDCDQLINYFTNQNCLVSNIIRSHQGATTGPSFEPEIEKIYDTGPESPPALDIPHGEIGAQAFYSILENIVRNTAKYGDPDQLARIKSESGDGKLRFTVSVKSRWEDQGKGWAKDFCQVEIIDRLETKLVQGNTNETVAVRLHRYFIEPLTSATGFVNPKNWGMKEIKICAAYLRMVKQQEIDSRFVQWGDGQHKKQPPIITVSLKPIPGRPPEQVGNLTYTLYLLRPKVALIVRDQRVQNEQDFRRAGVEFCSFEKFIRRTTQGATPRHSLLVIPYSLIRNSWDWLQQKRSFLPPRILVLDAQPGQLPSNRHDLARSIGFIQGPLPTSPNALLDALWTSWANTWWGKYKILVRWRIHNQTVAEIGRLETDDSVDNIGSDTLVFDHSSASDKTKLYEAAAYHESFSWGVPTQKMLQKGGALIKSAEPMTSTMLENISRQKIKEAAALSVAVIDERVWLEKDGPATEGVRHYKGDTSRINVWRKRRVFLQDTNLALQDFEQFVSSCTPPPGDTCFDFLIIHQGIIDSVREKMGGERFLATWRKLDPKARWVVIDSGRGHPEHARNEDLRWVEYSNLAECLVGNAGNKLKLAELLWTLRASAKNGNT